jgi:hypothetical protein
MESLVRGESSGESLESKIENIIESGKDLDQRQKIAFLGISFYQEFGKDKTEEILSESGAIHRRSVEELKKEGFSQDDFDWKERCKQKRKEIASRVNDMGALEFVKDIYVGADDPEPPNPKNVAGVFTYSYPNKDEDYIEVHLNKGVIPAESAGSHLQSSLELLCKKFVENKNIPEKVSGESWLMGIPAIRERLGFDIEFEKEFDLEKYDGIALWGQFVDSRGYFKQKEIEYLFENKEPRYKLTRASISISDLFHKYAPQYIGRELDSINDNKSYLEDQRMHEDLEKIKVFFKKPFTDESYQEMWSLIQKEPVWVMMLEKEEKKILGFFEGAKSKGVSFVEFAESLPKEDVEFFDTLFNKTKKEYLDSLVETKKVVIEQ